MLAREDDKALVVATPRALDRGRWESSMSFEIAVRDDRQIVQVYQTGRLTVEQIRIGEAQVAAGASIRLRPHHG